MYFQYVNIIYKFKSEKFNLILLRMNSDELKRRLSVNKKK